MPSGRPATVAPVFPHSRCDRRARTRRGCRGAVLSGRTRWPRRSRCGGFRGAPPSPSRQLRRPTWGDVDNALGLLGVTRRALSTQPHRSDDDGHPHRPSKGGRPPRSHSRLREAHLTTAHRSHSLLPDNGPAAAGGRGREAMQGSGNHAGAFVSWVSVNYRCHPDAGGMTGEQIDPAASRCRRACCNLSGNAIETAAVESSGAHPCAGVVL
jgi:hypothetical protein